MMSTNQKQNIPVAVKKMITEMQLHALCDKLTLDNTKLQTKLTKQQALLERMADKVRLPIPLAKGYSGMHESCWQHIVDAEALLTEYQQALKEEV